MSQGAVPAYPTPFTLHPPPHPTHCPGRYVVIEHVAAEPSSRLATVQSWVAPAVRALAGGCDVTRRTLDTIRAAGVCARAWVRRRHRPAQAAAAAAGMPAPPCGQLLLVGSHTPAPHPHPTARPTPGACVQPLPPRLPSPPSLCLQGLRRWMPRSSGYRGCQPWRQSGALTSRGPRCDECEHLVLSFCHVTGLHLVVSFCPVLCHATGLHARTAI